MIGCRQADDGHRVAPIRVLRRCQQLVRHENPYTVLIPFGQAHRARHDRLVIGTDDRDRKRREGLSSVTLTGTCNTSGTPSASA